MKKFLLALLVAVSLTGVAVADPILRLEDFDGVTLTFVEIADSDADGVVSFIGVLGGWEVNVTTGVGSAALPGGQGYLDLVSLNVDFPAGTARTLKILFSEHGLTTIYPGWSLVFGGTLSGLGATVTYDAYQHNGDGAHTFPLTSQIGSLGPFGPGAFAATTGSLVAGGVTSPYTLTQQLMITTTGLGVVFSGNAELNPIPEPTSLLLLGTGLLGFAAAARRSIRNKKKKV